MRPSSSFDINNDALKNEDKKVAFILLANLWPRNWRLRSRVILAMTCLVVAKIASVSIPFFYKLIVDALSTGGIFPLGILFGYGLARLGLSFFGELRDYIFIDVAQYAKRKMAFDTFRQLHQLSLSFHLDRQTGGLSRIIERGVSGISFILSFMLFNIIPSIVELIFVACLLSYYMDMRYPLIVLFSVVIYVIYTLAITEWRMKYRKEMNQKDNQANTKAIDSLLNYETVKYFGNEDHEHARFDTSLAAYEKSAIANQATLSMLNLGQALIIGIATLLMLYICILDVSLGKASVGDFVMVSTYMMQIFLPLNFLGFVYREMKQGLVDMAKMVEINDLEPEVQDDPLALDLVITEGAIEFKNVSFHYGPDRPILKDISFSVKAKQSLAIVGTSGAGKSTIARLLFRFYDTSAGHIFIDGQDVKKVTQKSLRKAMGVVPQDTVLFNDTIGYNIEYGQPGASDKDVEKAARLANLSEFVAKLPKNFATMVGERGLKLSGGEKQRVSIARTILKNPPILIFDEATSSLDSKTEAIIQAELRALADKKTTLIIAHRLSTIKDVDQIIVLDAGRIIERGTHEELLAHKGAYKQMWEKQAHEAT